MSNGHVWYFAYGSNMETATLRGRRGIEPLRALGARAAGWQLVLDKPPLVPVGEAFANIVPDARAAVLGVLYQLTPADWEHVELTRVCASATTAASRSERRRSQGPRSRWMPSR